MFNTNKINNQIIKNLIKKLEIFQMENFLILDLNQLYYLLGQ